MANKDTAVLNPAQVADRLGVSVRFVYGLLKEGKIPHKKLGDLYLISKVAFESWLLESDVNKDIKAG